MKKSLEAIKTRGKADLGDKTMIDAFQPAVLSLNNSNYSDLSEALQEAAAQANAGVERTKEFIAKFGRAKTLGERAIGHQDAGATTVAIIFEAMAEWVVGNVE
ncbi:dihydroxyacetone kinase [Bacillus sp. SORGH_AS 510]|uniref:DAK2 domain-containing protein n=1 Tax=Bacillus sp. SORGH_AS_0510 TaxID=3041771 RepID=UPI00278B81B4|nr:DAK2 domain-containing protein [Bacillus sp. SORGH_AS_0510]MDQ1143790.1 dihydroxyacetone kinase [Bacillus sp. SORGH_AS_0510]